MALLLDEINYCPRCGAAVTLTQRFGRQRPVCPQCDWIYFADPKVAAAALIFDETGRVLLVRRANSPQRGLWTLPAGFVDAGEDPAQAVQRECLEETGLRVQITGLIDVIAGQEHPRGAHILLLYRAQIVDGKLQAQDDVDGAGFFAVDALPSLAFDTTARVLAKILPPGNSQI
jgi:ADP-ribose pyrophosphatase YjhB (NUDIX family)